MYTSSKNTTAGDEKNKTIRTLEISHEPEITNNRIGVLNNIIEIRSPNQLMKEKRSKVLKGKG